MTLDPTDHIVGAWAERAAGPGWANSLIWVCVRSSLDGRIRVEAMQPEEQTREIATLFGVACAVSDELIAQVRSAVRRERPR